MISEMTGWKAVALLAVACVLTLTLSLACGSGDAREPTGPPPISVVIEDPSTPTVTPRPRKTPTPSPTPAPTPLVVCGPNPDPADPKMLQVEEPKPNAQVRVPVHVRGWGSNIVQSVPGGTPDPNVTPDPNASPVTPTPPPPARAGVALAVLDAKQSVQQVIDLPPQPRDFRVAPEGLDITDNTRPFAADLVIDVKEPTPICLWIYQETTPEGRARGVVQVPIIVLPR